MRFAAKVQTIALVDLVNYSNTAAMLEESSGVTVLGEFNSTIQKLVDQGLATAGIGRSGHVVMTTGDGALLRFPTTDLALAFAAGLHAASAVHNRGKSSAGAQCIFRVGIGTGDIAVDTEATEGNGLAGMAITRAARLEACADPGGTLIDNETWSAASPSLRAAYAGPISIAGKRDECFIAYRAGPVHPDPDTRAAVHPSSTREERRALVTSIISEARRLKRAIQISVLALRLQIPVEQQPADTLPIEKRLVEILEWADREDQLGEMLADLRGIIEATD